MGNVIPFKAKLGQSHHGCACGRACAHVFVCVCIPDICDFCL